MGKHRYGDFEKSPEQIPTNILAERLKRLVREEIMEKVCYQQRPPRYAYKLTSKGADLIEILRQLTLWGVKYKVSLGSPPEQLWKISSKEILSNQEKTISKLIKDKGQTSDA
jgi:DNA-binding HxlR family transcriptional regulator